MPRARIIAQRLLEMRERQGLSQQQLAKKLGVNEQTVSRWERGREQPHAKNLQVLAKVLRTEVEVLCGSKAMPRDELTAQERRALGIYQMNVRVRGDVRNAYTLVARRYRVPATRIVEIAPLLFLIAAERSLERRLKNLEQLQRLLDASDAMRSQFPHLPPSVTPAYRASDAIHAERASIEAKDILGQSIPPGVFDGFDGSDYDEAVDSPFACYLRDQTRDLSSAAQLIAFDEKWAVQYEVCEEEALALADSDPYLAGNIVGGNIPLHEMPREFFAPEALQERLDWMKSQVKEQEAAFESIRGQRDELENLLPAQDLSKKSKGHEHE